MTTEAKKVDGNFSSKNKSRARELNDFEKHAIVIEPSPVTMDTTSHLEISKMLNQKYSNEIVARASKAFNLKKLNKLKTKKTDRYLAEGKKQIDELFEKIPDSTKDAIEKRDKPKS